jgi:hypothetical protein
VKKLLTGIAIVAFIVLAVLAGERDPRKSAALKAAEDSAAVRRAPGGAMQVERDTLGGDWVLAEGRSPLDDSRTVEVWVADSRRVEGDGKAWPTLHVRCKENRTGVYVGTPARFSPPGQPEKLRDYDVAVRLRIDDGPIVEQTWREDPNATDIHAPGPIAFARRLAGRRALRLEYTTYEQGTGIAFFNVRGLEHWLGDVAKTCGWKFPDPHPAGTALGGADLRVRPRRRNAIRPVVRARAEGVLDLQPANGNGRCGRVPAARGRAARAVGRPGSPLVPRSAPGRPTAQSPAAPGLLLHRRFGAMARRFFALRARIPHASRRLPEPRDAVRARRPVRFGIMRVPIRARVSFTGVPFR